METDSPNSPNNAPPTAEAPPSRLNNVLFYGHLTLIALCVLSGQWYATIPLIAFAWSFKVAQRCARDLNR